MISRIADVSFDNVLFSEYGAYAFHANITDIPARSYDVMSVPGRNGSLIFDNGRYEDSSRVYSVSVDTLDNAMNLARKLKSIIGYAKLADDFEPEIYMIARVDSITTPIIVQDGVRMTITFTRKPQKFLIDGNSPVSYVSPNNDDALMGIYNPTEYDALPLVRVYGTGAVYIGDTIITINENEEYIDIDCDLQDAHNYLENLNSAITLTTGEFWKIKPEYNAITFDDTISKVTITPRWWTL